ncbi:MAG: glycosyltransferase family 9 protein [Fimbriiglobus sp.]|nr:glycosyltransferase family 9 protein [Fimbriiglobus sp.]
MELGTRNIRRVAILKPSALGDIAHAVPVLSAVRRLFPAAHLSWVVNRAYVPLLAGHPHLDAVIPFDRGSFSRGPLAATRYSLAFSDRLRRARFDLVLDLQGLLRTGLMTAATGAPVRIGFANAREGSRHFYTHRIEVPDADRLHAIDRYWRVVETLGGGHLTKEFILPVNAAELAAVDAELAPFPRPWVAVAAGARWLTKRWPVGAFAELGNRVHREFGGTLVLVGASDDTALSADLASRLGGPVIDYTGKTGIAKMVAVLRRADAMLSNDTGPLHVAAALGVPCVAPYLCTKPVLHGPYSAHGQSVAGVPTAVPCAGSYLRQCPNGLACMGELTPDKVWPALAEVLQSWRRGRN